MFERLVQLMELRWRTRDSDPERIQTFLSSSLVKRYFHPYVFWKCRQSLMYSYQTSPFYHELFKNAGIKPDDIKNPADMRKIPLTEPLHLMNPEQFFSVPSSSFVRVHSTAGSTGAPKRIYFTATDIEQQITRDITGFRLFYGMNKEDRVRIMYDTGYGTNDWGIRYCIENAVHRIGALAITTGGLTSAEEEYQLLSKNKVNNIFGTPSRLHSLTCQLEQDYDLKSLKIKNILVGAEPLLQSTRTRLENNWGADVFQGYGLTELGGSIAAECRQKDGMHITESDVFVEVIDPETNEILENGNTGELVFTSLGREGMPLLRYRTHDLGKIMENDCPCGLPFHRIHIKGRNDTVFSIGSGDKISPDALDAVLFALPYVVDYQLILERVRGKDTITLLVKTNKRDKVIFKEILDSLLKIPEIFHGVNNSMTINKPEIKIIKTDIYTKSVKAQRILDKRQLFG